MSATNYLAGLLQVGFLFTVSGEEVLEQIGYRDHNWAANLLQGVAPLGNHVGRGGLHAFATPEAEALLTGEVVALLCLADNVVTALYHEYILHEHAAHVASSPCLSKDQRSEIRNCQNAATKFRKLKEAFLKIAFPDVPPRDYKIFFDVSIINAAKRELYYALAGAPIVYRELPRYLTADYSKITKLRQKYRDYIYVSELSRSQSDPEMNFEVKDNGKF